MFEDQGATSVEGRDEVALGNVVRNFREVLAVEFAQRRIDASRMGVDGSCDEASAGARGPGDGDRVGAVKRAPECSAQRTRRGPGGVEEGREGSTDLVLLALSGLQPCEFAAHGRASEPNPEVGRNASVREREHFA